MRWYRGRQRSRKLAFEGTDVIIRNLVVVEESLETRTVV